MKIKKDLIIAVLTTFCLVATLFMILPSRSDPYDAWRDIDDDGDVDMKDIGFTLKSFGTMGDPTKNVTVTNWPKGSDVSVWYRDSIADGGMLVSGIQYSTGYSTLHLLIRITDITGGETVAFYVLAPLYNETHSAYYPITAYTYTFTSSDYQSAVSMNIPSEAFYFWFDAPEGTACTVSLSYYLTWA